MLKLNHTPGFNKTILNPSSGLFLSFPPHLQGATMLNPSINTSRLPFNPIKFLCSYGGKILPRHLDGQLRYFGGQTRVVAVDRSVSFSELLLKMGELTGSLVSLRCQWPKDDLDALVSITCDEDLVHLIQEYDRTASPPLSLKIRAFLSPPKSAKKISPPPSSSSSSPTSSSSPMPRATTPVVERCFRHAASAVGFPLYVDKPPLKHVVYLSPRNPSHVLINGNHWQ